MHQACPERSRRDHLTGTPVMSDTSGNSLGVIRYYPSGGTLSGSVSTDKLFTGFILSLSKYSALTGFIVSLPNYGALLLRPLLPVMSLPNNDPPIGQLFIK